MLGHELSSFYIQQVAVFDTANPVQHGMANGFG